MPQRRRRATVGRKVNGQLKKGFRLSPGGRVVKAKRKTKAKRKKR